MKTYCKPKKINIEDIALIERAVWTAFDGKYKRSDYRRLLLKTGLITEKELDEEIEAKRYVLRNKALGAIAEQIQSEIKSRNVRFREPKCFQRRDGLTGKLRDLCQESPKQQIYEHLCVECLMPLFKVKLLPQQFGSVPGKGQVKGAEAIARIIRSKLRGKASVVKTDIHKAYPSTEVETVMKMLERDVGKNKPLLWLLRVTMANYPGGVLVIGGYLSTWLFNYVMSYALREMLSSGRYRRGKWIRDVKYIVSYADDTACFGARSGLVRGTKKAEKQIKERFGLSLKSAWLIIDLPSFEEEKLNKAERRNGSKKRTPGVDMMGYVVRRSYTIMRKRIWRRVRRQYLRAAKELEGKGKITATRGHKVACYKGWPVHSDSDKITEKYGINIINAAASKAAAERSKYEEYIHRKAG